MFLGVFACNNMLRATECYRRGRGVLDVSRFLTSLSAILLFLRSSFSLSLMSLRAFFSFSCSSRICSSILSCASFSFASLSAVHFFHALMYFPGICEVFARSRVRFFEEVRMAGAGAENACSPCVKVFGRGGSYHRHDYDFRVFRAWRCPR